MGINFFMRLTRAFFAGAVGLLLVITLFSLLIPSRVRVSRAVLINTATTEAVFQQVAKFNNWQNWHPIFTKDSAKIYCHPPAIVGKDSGCSILQRGKEIKIHLIGADSNAIKFLLQAEGENDIENDIVLTNLPTQQSVQVEWRAITKLHWYPWEKFYGIFIDQLTGAGYEAALNGLKDYLEGRPYPKPVSN